ncbi:MAG: PorP/SprF family type IX secretion system membrane protein [Flavobacteriales bacterium]|nr:PorP/SprF family type IX secretion system membrane protein [Flavobacteriales bacterium]
MRFLFTYLLIFVTMVVCGQDVHFVQFTETPLLLNPGLTGVFDGTARVIVNYRDQWATVDAPYRTFGLNYDHRITPKKLKKKASLAVGLAAYRDDAGDLGLHTTSALISLASTLNLTREQFITAGIQSGILYRGVDMSNAIWGSQYDGDNYDPTIGSGEVSSFNSFISPDVSLGFSWNLNKPDGAGPFRDLQIRAGTGLFHLNRPVQKFNLSQDDHLHMRWTIHADAMMGVGSGRSYIVPMFLFQLQGPSTEAVFGASYRFLFKDAARVTGFIKGGAMSMGLTYRWGDALTPIVSVEYLFMRMGVSYDVNVSKLRQATTFQGGLEISLRCIIAEGFYYTGRQSKK